MPNSDIKIAIIEPIGGHGGMDYYDTGLCEALGGINTNVVLHTCDEFGFKRKRKFEIRPSFAGVFGKAAAWKRGLIFLRGSLAAIASATREGRKIVHFHIFHVGFLQFAQIAIARLFRRRVVITAHDVESFVKELEITGLNRLTYRLAHRVIAHNKTSREELLTKLGLRSERISTIPHGNFLDTIESLPTQTEARKKLAISSTGDVLLFFGQIKEVKGLDLLIDAMPRVLASNPDCKLLCAGRTWKCDFEAYEELMNANGVRDQCITHIRYIPVQDVPTFFAAADIVVLPYRRIYQSGVLLMAMSYGKPVLVSDIPGMTEIVEDGKNGFTFQRDDSNDLSIRLCELLNKKAQSAVVAKKGLQYVREKHGWENIAELTRNLYQQLIRL